MEEIRNDLISILKKYTFNNDVWEGFNDNYSITNDFKINSARVVDIIIDIENKYEIEITDEEFDELKSFADIIKLVEKKINNN